MGARGRKGPHELIEPPVRLVEPLELELPPPPPHLSEAMQSWWTQTVEAYELDAHHLRLLETACDAWDRMVQARETLREEGLTVTTKNGTRKHPCADIERDSRLAFARLIRELDLDCPEPRPGAYMPPPAIRSNRRR
jgi:P27 family predicted phage terminase small subunit